MFNENLFKRILNTQWLGHNVLYFEELESTNTYLKKVPREQISHGLLCLTDHQTKGRGQYENTWESEPAKNLTFTLAFVPAGQNRFHIITLACAKAIIEEVQTLNGFQTYIKWPNDIYVNDKKMGGLLTESTFSGNKIDRLLVGIGLNINQEQFSPELQGKAGSLKLLTGEEVSREEFLAGILSRIEYDYGRWHKRDNSLLKEINQKVQGYGQWVKLKVDRQVREKPAKLLGINEQGQLAVINREGDIETFSYEQIRVLAD